MTDSTSQQNTLTDLTTAVNAPLVDVDTVTSTVTTSSDAASSLASAGSTDGSTADTTDAVAAPISITDTSDSSSDSFDTSSSKPVVSSSSRPSAATTVVTTPKLLALSSAKVSAPQLDSTQASGSGGSSPTSDTSRPQASFSALLAVQTGFTAALQYDTGLSATDGDTAVSTLKGTAQANAVINFTVDGKAISSTATADANGNWIFRPTGLADGNHTIVANSTNAAGTPVSATVNFTLDATPPAVMEALAHDTGASATDNITNNPTITGTGDSGAIVSFRVDETLISATVVADSKGNWTFTPAGLADGVHTIEAFETDAAGNGSLATYTFTLDTTPPSITEALKNDTGVSATDKYTSDPTLTGKTVANAVVSFTIDGTAISKTVTADSNGNWTFVPTGLSDGTHTVVSIVTDIAGNVGSTAQTFTLDTTPPAVTQALLHDTGTSAIDRITSNSTVTGKGDANAVVHFTVDGQVSAATTVADTNGNWTFSPTGLADGQHKILASETDAAGNTGSSSLTFMLDTTPPPVTEALKHDSGVSATDNYTSDPTLTGQTEANAVVNLAIDGAAVSQTVTADTNGNWTFVPTGLSDGTHSVVASVTDVAGNVGSTTLAFTLDTTAPAVTESLVHDTGASAADNYTSNAALHGLGDPNAVVNLAIDGSTTPVTVVADASGNWVYTPASLTDGQHTVVATETDLAGNVGTKSLTFTLDTTPPVVTESLKNDTGVSNSDKLTYDPTLTGSAEANSIVNFAIDGSSITQTVTTDANGNWTFDPTGLADGVHTIVASETDLAGNVGSSSLTFTRDTTPPAVAITSKTGLKGQAVSGTSEAGATVKLYKGTTLLGSTVVSSNGSWSIVPTGLSLGDNMIDAVATDAAGNSTTTAASDFIAYSKIFANSAGGNWATASNWSPASTPVSGDYVDIGTPVAVTLSGWNYFNGVLGRIDSVAGSSLTITDGGLQVSGVSNLQGAVVLNSAALDLSANDTIGSLTINRSSDSLNGTQLINYGTTTTVTSNLVWTQGYILGNGTAGDTVVAAGAAATIGSSNGNQYLGEELDIYGSANLVNASLFLGNYQSGTSYTGTLHVETGGSLTIDDQSQIAVDNSGDASSIINDGTITKVGAGTTGIFDAPFQNNGTINVTTGTLDLSSTALTNAGTINVTGGATLTGDTVTTIANIGIIAVSNGAWVHTNITSNSGTINVASGSELDTTADTTNTGTINVGASADMFALGKLIGGGVVNLSGQGSAVVLSGASDNTFNFSTAVNASETLQINQSSSFSGQINGFGAASMIDLADMISGYDRLSYVQTGNGGILSVTDGSHTAQLAISGANSIASFDVKSDGAGGTMVVHA